MSLDLALQVVGGVPLVVLGVAILFLPRRRLDVVLLAGFAVLWGLGVECIALSRAFAASPFADAFASAYSLANVLAVACLLGSVSWMRVRRAQGRAVTVLIVALAAVGVAGVLVGTEEGAKVAALAYLAGFSLALVIAYRGYRRASSGSARQRERVLLGALTLLPAYLLASFGVTGLEGEALDLVVLLPVLVIHADAFLRPPPPERRDGWLAMAFVVPFATGLLVAFDPRTAGPALGGLWRFATAALLAYAIARTRLFDVELRLRRHAGPALGALALVAGLAATAVLAATGEGASASLVPLAAGAGVGSMLVAARGPVGEKLFPVDESEAYVRARKLEVYAAAVQAAARAGLGVDAEEVRRLRRTFDVTPAEHAAVAASALPAREERRLVLQRYRLLHPLGEGGQGSTFLARDERTGIQVAVKLVSRYGAAAAKSGALLQEARLASSLEHRHVVKVLAADVDGDDAALVMEYAPGGNLRSLLRRKGPALPVDEALRLADDVLSALSACHARGIVHGDVKPENVLLDASTPPRAVLGDFGVAREGAAATAATVGAVGTLLYMAPEQVRGHPARPESDVYAAAVMLHEMLTGRHPLRIAGRDDYQIRQLILEGPVGGFEMRGDAAPYALALQAGMETRPEDRPTAAALRAMLADPPAPRARSPPPT